MPLLMRIYDRWDPSTVQAIQQKISLVRSRRSQVERQLAGVRRPTFSCNCPLDVHRPPWAMTEENENKKNER